MNYFLSIYQHLPEKINPVAFSAGPFFVRWYPLMYLVAFAVVYGLLLYRIKKGEAYYTPGQIMDFLFYAFLGVLIGGRLGYVLFYNLSGYLADPWSIILPFNSAGNFIGFYGMSYHGGLIGVLLATWYFVRKNKINPHTKKQDKNYANNISSDSLKKSNFGEGVNFWAWADFAIPAVPAGFFFGRIGNFLNGELYGRITNASWGMYFPAGGEMLRHPSQLYEAFFEGLVLFLILWTLRNGIKYKGKMFHVSCFMLYIFLYGLFRIFAEFFREPDPQLGLVVKWDGNGLTLGQILSLGMVLFSVCLFLYQRHKKVYNITSSE